ncbi:MAG TPA: AarF/ABC1/UbiB kinase family protein [Candidatus Saccharimonadales bacterium]|nr:AarF/ABC1/UbiB kinase family protein [Candidatus Saccharimonadales bacterium]
MKQPRTIRIMRLMTHVMTSILRGEKLMISSNTDKIGELGGIYVKFLQLVVINLDPNNQVGYKQLLKVYENSQPDPIDVKRYLASQLSAQNFAKIKSIEPQPFATGSFGQVYHARLWDDRSVVVKVLRPSVIKYLKYDLRLLNALTWLYNLADRKKMLNFRSMFKDFKHTSLNETDYVREAAVADSYWESYQNHPHMVIPRTYMELCSKHVIVQDYIQGVSVAQLLALQTSSTDAAAYCLQYLQSDLHVLLSVIGVEIVGRALVGEIVQADPHPGNIIILPGNRVALIDFGMSAIITKDRMAFYDLVVQYQKLYSGHLAIEDFTLCALRCLAPVLYVALEQTDGLITQTYQVSIFEKLRVAVKEYFDETNNKMGVSQDLQRFSIMKVLFFGINKDNRFGFSFDLSATSMWKATQTYFVLAQKFDPSGTIILNALNEVIWQAAHNMDRIAGSPQTQMSSSEALETLSCWFDKMARNDPWLMSRMVGNYIK